jgi:hypothetical protein
MDSATQLRPTHYKGDIYFKEGCGVANHPIVKDEIKYAIEVDSESFIDLNNCYYGISSQDDYEDDHEDEHYCLLLFWFDGSKRGLYRSIGIKKDEYDTLLNMGFDRL